jgi:organic radical activating enzyme
MKKFDLPYIEFMVMRNCNLSCDGCTTFSDHTHPGNYPQIDEIIKELKMWGERVNFDHLGTMGGEPLLNPYIQDLIVRIREEFPNVTIRFVTNGLLLEKHKPLIDKLHEIGNVILKITKHVNDERVKNIVKYIMNRFDWEPVTEFHIHRWLTTNSFRFQVNAPEKFFRTFRGTYFNMQPHDNNPAEAFDMCVQKTCPLLYDGKLFKCGTLALTPDMLNKMGQLDKPEWANYINAGLDIHASDAELDKWIKNFGKPNALCRQCPTKHNTESIIDHRKNVTFK